MQIYIVKQGDSVDTVAEQYGVSTGSLIYNNQLEYPYSLAVGQALLVSVGQEENKRMITAGGYAYPFISSWVLLQTLPYLSELMIFSYGFSEGGYLIAPMLDDTWMIDEARQYQAVPVLTLTPLGPMGRFDNQLISAVVNNAEARERLIGQVAETVQEKGYGGVNIDFEYILVEDRDAFTNFVRLMTERMNSLGYQVSVALAPKTSADQKGVLYEGKDYAALGEAADSVLLMTYEWGYTYGPAMAVAPISMVRRVVEYAVSEIPAEKISLGIPNYGYDWPLPYERGVTRAKTIGNVEAVQIAIAQGAEILFDEMAQSPYFRYWRYGVEHEVWFEDVRSLSAKFDLIDEYGLRGAGYWQIMQLFRANWLLLAGRFNIRKE